jgi:hypothetical protein
MPGISYAQHRHLLALFQWQGVLRVTQQSPANKYLSHWQALSQSRSPLWSIHIITQLIVMIITAVAPKINLR